MASLDRVFVREFRDMMNVRRSIVLSMEHGFSLSDIPVPVLNCSHMGVPKRPLALVKGVKEKFFERLNGREVYLVGKTMLKKRQVLSDGTFRRDSNGNFVYMHVPVNKDCVAVLSDLSIGLRGYVNGKKHVVSEGFKYVDFLEKNGKRWYIYILPKKYVYRLNLCALMLSFNKRRNYYVGYRFALQNGHYVYLYVVPFRYRENAAGRVLCVKSSFDFSQEIECLVRYWVECGVIFNLDLTKIEDTSLGIGENIGYEYIPGTLCEDDFVRYRYSLGEEKEFELDEVAT